MAESALSSVVESTEYSSSSNSIDPRNETQAANLVSSALQVAETTNRLLFLLLRKGNYDEIEYLATKCLSICQVGVVCTTGDRASLSRRAASLSVSISMAIFCFCISCPKVRVQKFKQPTAAPRR